MSERGVHSLFTPILKIVKKPAVDYERLLLILHLQGTSDAAAQKHIAKRIRPKIVKKLTLGAEKSVNDWNTARTSDAAAQKHITKRIHQRWLE